MEIEVSVLGENAMNGEVWPTVECRVILVAMNDDGKPTPVPPRLLESEADRKAQAAADERRSARLAKRA
jgi:acyl-CoA hydrolase